MGAAFGGGSPRVVQAPPPPTPKPTPQQAAQETAAATAAARTDTDVATRERADERRRRAGSGARVLAGETTGQPMTGSKRLLG